MKTNQGLKKAIVMIFVAANYIGCNKSSSNQSSDQSIAEAKQLPAPPAPPPLEKEAVEVAEKGFIETWTSVRDSWFTLNEHYGPKYLEIKGITIRAAPEQLSQADILNGLQWDGWVYFTTLVSRSYNLKTQQWSEWSNGEPDDVYSTTKYKLTKRDHYWRR